MVTRNIYLALFALLVENEQIKIAVTNSLPILVRNFNVGATRAG